MILPYETIAKGLFKDLKSLQRRFKNSQREFYKKKPWLENYLDAGTLQNQKFNPPYIFSFTSMQASIRYGPVLLKATSKAILNDSTVSTETLWTPIPLAREQ